MKAIIKAGTPLNLNATCPACRCKFGYSLPDVVESDNVRRVTCPEKECGFAVTVGETIDAVIAHRLRENLIGFYFPA